MELNPVRERAAQRYPHRRKLPPRGTWLRTALAAVGVSAALMVGGCVDGGWPFGEERLAGAMVMTMFECADEPPAEPQALYFPGVSDGELCGDQTAWAAVDIEQSEELTFSFTYGEGAVLHVIAPSGIEVGSLSSDDGSELTLQLTAGRWLLAATALEPDPDTGAGWGMFGLSIEEPAP